MGSAKSNAGSSWGEKDKMESNEHLKVPKESDTWSDLPQKTPRVIWLQHQWAIQMLPTQDRAIHLNHLGHLILANSLNA